MVCYGSLLLKKFPLNPLFSKIANSDRLCHDFESFMLISLLLEIFGRWKCPGLHSLPYSIYSGQYLIFHRSYPLELYVIELPPGRGIAHISSSCQVWFCVCLVLVELNTKETHNTVLLQLNFR